MTEIRHQRAPQDQVVQVNNFFFFSQKSHFAASHFTVVLERRIIPTLESADFATTGAVTRKEFWIAVPGTLCCGVITSATGGELFCVCYAGFA